MNNRLHEHLKSLKSIRPEAGFLARGRANLINAITPAPKHTFFNYLTPVFKMSFATATLAVILLISSQATSIQTSEEGLVASLDTEIIQTEHVAINATGSIASATYFKNISPVISLALRDIADPSMNWGSETKAKQAIAVLTNN